MRSDERLSLCFMQPFGFPHLSYIARGDDMLSSHSLPCPLLPPDVSVSLIFGIQLIMTDMGASQRLSAPVLHSMHLHSRVSCVLRVPQPATGPCPACNTSLYFIMSPFPFPHTRIYSLSLSALLSLSLCPCSVLGVLATRCSHHHHYQPPHLLFLFPHARGSAGSHACWRRLDCGVVCAVG